MQSFMVTMKMEKTFEVEGLFQTHAEAVKALYESASKTLIL